MFQWCAHHLIAFSADLKLGGCERCSRGGAPAGGSSGGRMRASRPSAMAAAGGRVDDHLMLRYLG